MPMTQLNQKNNGLNLLWKRIIHDNYLTINIIFAGMVLLVFAYSGIFSPDRDNYPVTCIHKQITGEPCVSCGLSHSFSLILKGRINEAYQWNRNGMRVFLFFASQLLMRIFYSAFCINHPQSRKQLILFDIIGSIIIFAIAFYPFIRQIF
jgi:hypothetical protein